MQLAALGYVEGMGTEIEGPLADPKDRKRLIGLSQRAERRAQEMKLGEAAETLQTLIDEYPEVMEFRQRLSVLYGRMGKPDKSLAVIDEALALHPDNVALRNSKAGMLARTGQFREAAELFRSVAEDMPYSPRIRAMAVAALLSTEGGQAEAMALGEQYLEDYPDDFLVAGMIGVEYAKLNNGPKAVPLLEKGMLADKPEYDVAYALSAVARSAGDMTEARRLLEIEIDNWPKNKKAAMALARILTMNEDWEGEIVLMDMVG